MYQQREEEFIQKNSLFECGFVLSGAHHPAIATMESTCPPDHRREVDPSEKSARKEDVHLLEVPEVRIPVEGAELRLAMVTDKVPPVKGGLESGQDLGGGEDVRGEDVRGEDVHGEGSPPQGGS